MNFTQLLAFFEVARAGSISAGAEHRHVNQPTVTRKIRELEDRLGLALLIGCRAVSGITDAGTVLLSYAEQIFSLAYAVERELRELAGLGAGRLTVGASATLGVYFLPELVARFHAAHPQVEVDLVVANTERVEAGLREHVFALGFVEGPAEHHIRHIGDARSDPDARVPVGREIMSADYPARFAACRHRLGRPL
jgi:DNA-binding transcriptional LysR family regulator